MGQVPRENPDLCGGADAGARPWYMDWEDWKFYLQKVVSRVGQDQPSSTILNSKRAGWLGVNIFAVHLYEGTNVYCERSCSEFVEW